MKCPCGQADYVTDPRPEHRMNDGAACVQCGSQIRDGKWTAPTKEPWRSKDKAPA